jgi:hypothetical protein
MSSNPPPTGPPPGDPSRPSWGPPSGPPPPPPPAWQGGSAEVLQSGRGAPVAPGSRRTRGGRRAGVVAAGALVGVGVLAAGAWAGYAMFFATGAQPAEALPDSTLGYVSVDLDPSGQQKLEALQTLRSFPAFAENVDLDADDDLRLRLFEELQGEGLCDELDFADDIDPWLGNRFAAAAVDTGEDDDGPGVAAVGVIQVDDAAAAEEGLAALGACGGEGDAFGYAVDGDWAVVAETTEIAEQVSEAAAEASLADDDDFDRWTGEAGDPGILTAYAAPEAGRLLADAASGFGVPGFGFGGPSALDCLPLTDPFAEDPLAEDPFSDDFLGEAPLTGESFDCGELDPLPAPEGMESMTAALDDFEGAAMTIRFDDGGLTVQTAVGSSAAEAEDVVAGDGAELVGSLPEDTAVAFGFALEEGWFDAVSESAEGFLGEGGLDGLLEEAEGVTGLSLPEDVETLLGEATAVALGGDVDLAAFDAPEPPDDLPLAMKVRGDAGAITDVLERLVETSGDPSLETLLATDDEDDVVVVGPSDDYRSSLLDDGGLDDTDAYRDAVLDSDDAAAVLFVNFDAGDWLTSAPGLDEEIRRNLEPLRALGLSSRVDDGVSHGALRITTE